MLDQSYFAQNRSRLHLQAAPVSFFSPYSSSKAAGNSSRLRFKMPFIWAMATP